MSSITPTVGRKVWYWSGEKATLRDLSGLQPFDATVVFVNQDNSVNLHIVAHNGITMFKEAVLLQDPKPTDCHGTCGQSGYATWMPYQVGQAKKPETSA